MLYPKDMLIENTVNVAMILVLKCLLCVYGDLNVDMFLYNHIECYIVRKLLLYEWKACMVAPSYVCGC